ncbi:MAG: acetyltransferase [Chloroflexaceae bacterium]|nr:acetyltransferase [Chloroflexaceae bacterium]
MFLKDKQTQDLIEIQELEALINPTHDRVQGQVQAGQNEQPPSTFSKQDLSFPSGEDLPRCWLDADYRLKAAPH